MKPSHAPQARLDGQVARLRGLPATSNPFPLNTNTSQAWSRGYRGVGEQK